MVPVLQMLSQFVLINSPKCENVFANYFKYSYIAIKFSYASYSTMVSAWAKFMVTMIDFVLLKLQCAPIFMQFACLREKNFVKPSPIVGQAEYFIKAACWI